MEEPGFFNQNQVITTIPGQTQVLKKEPTIL